MVYVFILGCSPVKTPSLTKISSNGHGINGGSGQFLNELSIDELDNLRLREITGKAVSGTLLLLLKWFKRSRKSKPLRIHILLDCTLTDYRYSEI